MKHRLALWLCVLACAGMAGADVIIFHDGSYDEGYANRVGAFVNVRGRDGKSEYSVSTTIIARIEYNRWYSELNEAGKASAPGGPITILNTQKFLVATTSDAVQQQARKQWRAFAWLNTLMKKDGPRISARGTVQAVTTLVITIGFIICLLIATIASICLIIDAFKRSVLWGLLCLLCGIGLFIYLFTEYEYVGWRGRMFLCLTAPLWWLLLTIGIQQLMRLLT